MDIRQIEEKWNPRLLEAAVAKPDSRKKFYLTPAFPYPNSPQHIGHGRTYTTTDIYARYQRLLGKNVLFPMAFHVTGTPILAMAKRLKEGDRELIEIFESIYGISRETIAQICEPEKLVLHFSKEIEQGMREMGYGIDWTRKFYTFDPHFNRFIEWQFRKLHEKGLIVKGSHPVPWCPSCNNALGAHDTQGDKDPELEEVSMLLFRAKKKDLHVAVATYRPETIFGVTNIWLNPKIRHLIVELEGKKIAMSEKSLENIGMQFNLKKIGEISSEELLELVFSNPIDGSDVPVLKAEFVDESFGTGIVMSVPAHAPFDYLALRDLGFPGGIEPKVVIGIEGFTVPAKEIVERDNVKDQNDPKAHDVTKELYKLELSNGIMSAGYPGMPVEQARKKVTEELGTKGLFSPLHIIANHPVKCRCGATAGVRKVQNQWFIDYGTPEWKEKARKCLAGMSILPNDTRKLYEATIEWLERKACTREQGLGTRFPFDQTKMIEALSDSTVYMAFYTIANRIREFQPEQLSEQFFDHLFYGKGEAVNPTHSAMRKEFLYWYPLDSRHSAYDLVRNHLTFFIFNHVGIFPEEHWPRQIVTNGFVLMDGKKMSKSFGNILPLRKAIAEFGADIVRFSIVYGADLSTDTDFSTKSIDGLKQRLGFFEQVLGDVAHGKELEQDSGMIDKWLYHRANRMVEQSLGYYQTLEIRKLSQAIFYDLFNDMKWYVARRGTHSTKAVRYTIERFVQLVYPFMPHLACEWHSILWESDSVKEVEAMGISKVDPKMINSSIEASELMVTRMIEDIKSILSLIKKEKPDKRILLIVSGAWKRKLIEVIKGTKDMKEIMKLAGADPLIAQHKSELFKLAQKFLGEISSYPESMPSAEDEKKILDDAREFLGKQFGCAVEVELEDSCKNEKKRNAMPLKPAIVIE